MGTRDRESSIDATLKHIFHTFSLTILSLLLPLSFFLLARLTSSPHLYTKLIQCLVALVCLTALLSALTNKLIRPSTRFAWTFACFFQLCITIGVEGTISSSPVQQAFGVAWPLRAVFIIGLHGVTLHWSDGVVRSIVDDTIFGFSADGEHEERVLVGGAFSVLWLWLLQGEVEAMLVGVALGVQKLEVLSGGFGCFFVCYVTTMVGVVRLVKGLVWMGKHLFLDHAEAETKIVCFSLGDGRVWV
ncbi:hypothetical protein QJS04_geneDACA007075 [Acorus gramineus]|uniref:Transmembrane protein n=1 Tax=Acorus gramineus TaxID=55184 RepID=A0AAV9BQ97_ACOGR|nr:hypothetical protein QJS04_geneDACA007075 [Acorus gramineus]